MGKNARILEQERKSCYNEVNDRYINDVKPEEIDDDEELKPNVSTTIYKHISEYIRDGAYPLCEYLDETIIDMYVDWVIRKV
jgi:hemoglobin-like flavoprotein